MRRVRIHRVDGGSFGRMAGRTVDLGDHDFVVVSGPNESGKSTLAELISWVLAGRRNHHDVGLRFVSSVAEGPGAVDISATVDGSIDGLPFSVQRSFRIRRANRGRQPAEAVPVITIGGSAATLDTWSSGIGVASGDDYFRRYRITGPYDPDSAIEIRPLLEALAAGSAAHVSPRAVLQALSTRAGALVPGPGGRITGERAIKEPMDALDLARAARRRVNEDQSKIDAISREIEALETDVRRIADEKVRVAADLDATRAARHLLPARDQLEEARRELDGLAPVPAGWSTVVEAPGAFDVALARLADQETAVSEAATELGHARIAAGLDEDEAETIEVTPADVADVTRLDRDLTKALDDRSEARRRRTQIDSDLAGLRTTLAAKAAALGTTTDHLRSFAVTAIDDTSFGDPLRDWSVASSAVDDHITACEAAQAESERAREALADLESRWVATGETRSPEAVLAGVSSAQPPVPSKALVAMALVAIGVVATASAFGPSAAVAAAVVAAVALAFVVRRATSTPLDIGVATTPDLRALAEQLVGARQRHTSADTGWRDAEAALERARSNLRSRAERANAVLTGFGFTAVVDLDGALRVRAERPAIVELVGRLTGAETEVVELDRTERAAEAAIASIDSARAAIATRCGLPGVGSTLDESLISRLQAVHTARVGLVAARGRREAARTALVAIAAGAELADDVELVREEFERVRSLATAHVEAHARLEVAGSRLEHVPPRVSALLADPDLSDTVLEVRITELEAALLDLEERGRGSDHARGALAGQLEGLTAHTDLAAISQAIEQSRAVQRRIAVEGAASWLAHRIVADVKEDVEATQQPELVKRAGELAARISAGYWHSVSADTEDGGILVRQGGGHIHQRNLSAGATDVLRLAVRLAVAETHSARVGVALPLILDDPTASIDSERAPQLFEVLRELAGSHQVILMTHDEHTVARAVAVGAVEVGLERP